MFKKSRKKLKTTSYLWSLIFAYCALLSNGEVKHPKAGQEKSACHFHKKKLTVTLLVRFCRGIIGECILTIGMSYSGHCTMREYVDIWDLLTQCINFYSHSLIFPAILPPLIVYNLFIWWYRWVSGEEYYHFLYFAFSVAQTVQKLQVSCFFRSVNGSRESHYTLQHP